MAAFRTWELHLLLFPGYLLEKVACLSLIWMLCFFCWSRLNECWILMKPRTIGYSLGEYCSILVCSTALQWSQAASLNGIPSFHRWRQMTSPYHGGRSDIHLTSRLDALKHWRSGCLLPPSVIPFSGHPHHLYEELCLNFDGLSASWMDSRVADSYVFETSVEL